MRGGGGGLVFIRMGTDTLLLDFNDSRNPARTAGGPVTAAFPAGHGEDRPILFDEQIR